MAGRSAHPDVTVEHLLQELEQQGVDASVIEAFACRAAKRYVRHATAPRATRMMSTSARVDGFAAGIAVQADGSIQASDPSR